MHLSTAVSAAPPRSLSAALVVTVVVQLVMLVLTLASPALAFGQLAGALPSVVVVGLQILGVLTTAIGLWRVYLAARYRAVDDVGDARLPRLTVVVPAYNEGRQVLLTLRSLAASHYPRERLQIIAVDDGSADDTWHWIRQGAEELGALVTAYRCPRNGGKKHALVEGFKRATGSIIVTVDSDCEVLPDTLRLLVAPFVVDDTVGAVAGNVRVLNREAGRLPKMLDACFTTAFDFVRSGESEAGSVLCCPGALSAFRKDLLDGVVDEWLAQTFFGQPATIGEDRALTNLIIRTGADVRYQANSIILTQVPSTYSVLCKMFMRWERSNVRESLVLGKFVFSSRDLRGRPRRGLQLMFVWSVVAMALSAALFVPTVLLLIANPMLLPSLLVLALISAVPSAAVVWQLRDRDTAAWALPWGLYVMLTSWIAPVSVLTMHRGGWLTRAVSAGVPTSIETAKARTMTMVPEHSGATARAA
jgi:hyaluronan synthase